MMSALTGASSTLVLRFRPDPTANEDTAINATILNYKGPTVESCPDEYDLPNGDLGRVLHPGPLLERILPPVVRKPSIEERLPAEIRLLVLENLTDVSTLVSLLVAIPDFKNALQISPETTLTAIHKNITHTLKGSVSVGKPPQDVYSCIPDALAWIASAPLAAGEAKSFKYKAFTRLFSGGAKVADWLQLLQNPTASGKGIELSMATIDRFIQNHLIIEKLTALFLENRLEQKGKDEAPPSLTEICRVNTGFYLTAICCNLDLYFERMHGDYCESRDELRDLLSSLPTLLSPFYSAVTMEFLLEQMEGPLQTIARENYDKYSRDDLYEELLNIHGNDMDAAPTIMSSMGLERILDIIFTDQKRQIIDGYVYEHTREELLLNFLKSHGSHLGPSSSFLTSALHLEHRGDYRSRWDFMEPFTKSKLCLKRLAAEGENYAPRRFIAGGPPNSCADYSFGWPLWPGLTVKQAIWDDGRLRTWGYKEESAEYKESQLAEHLSLYDLDTSD